MGLRQHRALFINEILEAIFSHLASFDDYRNRRTLARLARTSKTFYDPAITILWRVLPSSLLPLFRILPSFYQKNNAFLLHTPILPEEWDRLFDHAKLVHQFSYTHDERIDKSVYEELQRVILLRDKPLFPSLHTLRWAQACETDTEVISFASGSLRNLTIDLFQHDFGVYDNVTTSTMGTPHVIESFLASVHSVQGVRLSGPIVLAWMRPIIGYKYLRSLRLGLLTGSMVDEAFLHDLSRLDNLSELELGATSPADQPGPGLETPRTIEDGGGFLSLRTLAISGSPATLTKIFTMISTPSLRDLSIATDSFREVQEWQACFIQLETKFQPSIRRFSIRALPRSYLRFQALNETDDVTQRTTSVAKFLAPLFNVTCLEELYFDDGDGTSVIFDADFLTIGACWPNLKSLYIWYRRRDPSALSAPLPTFQALSALAANCHSLVSVSIELNTQKPTSNVQIPDSPVQSHPLKNLNLLGNSSISRADKPQIILFLTTFFPNLRWLEVHCYDLDMNNLWKQVIRSLHSAQAKKKERAKWGGASRGKSKSKQQAFKSLGKPSEK